MSKQWKELEDTLVKKGIHRDLVNNQLLRDLILNWDFIPREKLAELLEKHRKLWT
jgi:hypothetical protein